MSWVSASTGARPRSAVDGTGRRAEDDAGAALAPESLPSGVSLASGVFLEEVGSARSGFSVIDPEPQVG